MAELRRNTHIVTVETAKHRFFVFLNDTILPDNMLVNIALSDAFHLGVLSSRVHVSWALGTGGTLGLTPRYNKSRCFEAFPFPDATDEQRMRIRNLGEQLNSHREERLKTHPKLTMTGIYNVLEKLKTGEQLSAREREVHAQGLVSILKDLHEQLDEAVLEATEQAARQVPAQPWPSALPEQARAIRAALGAAGTPLASEEAVRLFKGARRERVNEILETLVSLGQLVKLADGRYAR